MIEDLTPVPEQSETTAEDYIDPYGKGPDIPDPMPESLQRTPEVDEGSDADHPMEGGAPTG